MRGQHLTRAYQYGYGWWARKPIESARNEGGVPKRDGVVDQRIVQSGFDGRLAQELAQAYAEGRSNEQRQRKRRPCTRG